MTEASVSFSQPKVVRRVYKIQYQPTPGDDPGSGSQQRSGSKRNPQRRMSMKAYDSDTDNDIFKLGSAFKSGQFNIDEFLNSWSNNSGYTIQKVETSTSGTDNGTTTTITQVSAITPTSDEAKTPTQHSPCESIAEIQSSPNFPGVVRRQRIVTITRANGDQETKEFPPETFINSVASVTPSPVVSTSIPTPPEPVHCKPVTTNSTPEPDASQRKPLLASIGEEVEATDDEILETVPAVGEAVSLDMGETVSSSEEEIITHWRSSLCPGKKPGKRKKRKLGMADCIKGGRSGGMAASEVSVPGQEMKLPAIQKLVLNYSRMLDRSRELFIETMFRAVKLNGLDVVKILCQLVMRKNIPLGSVEMREPESSATVLHVALLYDHEQIVQYLVGLKDRDLLMATYTKEEYRNQTALHVAVANGNINCVQMLLGALNKKDKKTLMNTVATGTYFQQQHPEGQLCLSAAAWSGNSDILILLAKQGASFALANVQGNTLLHSIVLSSTEHSDHADFQRLIDKVYEAVGEWTKHCKYKAMIMDQRELEQKQKQINTFQKLLNLQNNDGVTPLILAAQLGSPLLLYLINMEKIFKIPQTKLGSIAWVTYDVTDITSFSEGSYNKFSVLHILAHNSGKLSRHANLDPDQGENFLDTEPMKSIINMKWRVYRWIYIAWFLLHVIYVVLFTYATFENNSVPYTPIINFDDSSNNSTYYGSTAPKTTPEIKYSMAFFTILPAVYIILEFIDWFGNYPYSILFMRNQSMLTKVVKRIQSEWVITGNGPYRFVGFGYALSSIFWYIFYIQTNDNQDIALAIALLLGWIFVLFFTRGCRVISRFSIMIQKMFFRDLMYFLAVYVMILAAFSFSINAMYSTSHMPSISLPMVMYRMMNIVTGLDADEFVGEPRRRGKIGLSKADTEQLLETRHPFFTKILLVFYAIVAVILLMNMLIAMMNTSYETVRITRCNIWKQQQLSIMLMMERRLFWCTCLCNRSEADVWHKEWEETTRAYIDVTTTQNRERSCSIEREGGSRENSPT